jgi:hypothetical protein
MKGRNKELAMFAVSPRGSQQDKHKKILLHICLNPGNDSVHRGRLPLSPAQIAFHNCAALRKSTPTSRNSAEYSKKTFD